jgi:C4-type Zn-finger protein
MTAIARPYTPGAESTNFQIQFGTLVTNGEGVVERFNGQLNTQLTLTKEELSTWGTNDEILLSIIAEKLGVNVIEFIEVSRYSF